MAGWPALKTTGPHSTTQLSSATTTQLSFTTTAPSTTESTQSGPPSEAIMWTTAAVPSTQSEMSMQTLHTATYGEIIQMIGENYCLFPNVTNSSPASNAVIGQVTRAAVYHH